MRVGILLGVVIKDVADHAPHVPTGVGVVADIGHAGAGQLAGANLENLVLNLGGYPGVHAVTKDVIKFTQISVDIRNADRFQFDVREPQRAHDFLAIRDLTCGEIHADKSALGQVDRYGNEIAPPAATDLP